MTPRAWLAFFECHLAAEERMDRRFGSFMAMYYNAHRPAGQRAMRAEEFFPRRAHSNIVSIEEGPRLVDPALQVEMARQFTEAYRKLKHG